MLRHYINFFTYVVFCKTRLLDALNITFLAFLLPSLLALNNNIKLPFVIRQNKLKNPLKTFV
jgi:hypothetical protein